MQAMALLRRPGWLTKWATDVPSQAGVIGDDFSEENDRLGAAIHVAGHEALVGAPGVNDQGAVRRLLLSDSGEEWEREASLMPFDGGARLFGSAIAADDTSPDMPSPEKFNEK